MSKLSDFGLAKLLRENYYIVNRSGSGTVTHLAPELFQVRASVLLLLRANDEMDAGLDVKLLITGASTPWVFCVTTVLE